MTGEELKQWRTERGLTQTDLANFLSVPQSRISEWERGVYKVPRWMPLELKQFKPTKKGKKS
jgi:transcriptional regulator with XRE-family HTH domain